MVYRKGFDIVYREMDHRDKTDACKESVTVLRMRNGKFSLEDIKVNYLHNWHNQLLLR